MSKTQYDTDRVISIFNTEQNITNTAKQYCKEMDMPYNDGIRRRFSDIIKKNKHLLGLSDNPPKIMIYDIETSLCKAHVWWPGKQYVGHKQLLEEPKIITVAWKWLGEDKVQHLTWDKDQSDKQLMIDFLAEYNKADMVIGQNNDNFDNRWVNARAMKYDLDVNVFIKSFDIMKQTKRLFRLPSYSMAYITDFLGVTQKQSHEGIDMWKKIQWGTPAEQEEYLQKMVDYNVGDIVSTEDMYLALQKYTGHKVHFGVFSGKEKFTCPECGGHNLELVRTTFTPAGTIQRIMRCKDDGKQFKLSNTEWIKYTNKDD